MWWQNLLSQNTNKKSKKPLNSRLSKATFQHMVAVKTPINQNVLRASQCYWYNHLCSASFSWGQS